MCFPQAPLDQNRTASVLEGREEHTGAGEHRSQHRYRLRILHHQARAFSRTSVLLRAREAESNRSLQRASSHIKDREASSRSGTTTGHFWHTVLQKRRLQTQLG